MTTTDTLPPSPLGEPEDAARERLAEAMLDHAPFDGWSAAAVQAASRDLGLPAGEADRLFPGGPLEIIDWIDRRATGRMVAELDRRGLAGMKIRDKVALAVRLRLEPLNARREALRRAAAYMILPLNAPRAAEAVYRTVDAIWYAIGDTSTDFNFYTKRALLAGVYTSTMLVWLNDRSSDCEATWSFLARRIADVMHIEKMKGSIGRALSGTRQRPAAARRPRRTT